jgi:Uma2 family endonuclease
MSNPKTQFPTDTWVKATWDEYLQAIENLRLEKAKCYYHNGQLRIEMTPLGNDHASDHTVIMLAVNLFAILKGIDFNGKDNCTYRKTG